MSDAIRVLLAEDSATIRRYLITLLEETPDLRVVGEARDGREVLQMMAELRPDVVSMDIRMPGMDGLEATRRIMAQQPTPVVVVSGMLEDDVALSLQALKAGALAVVGKPPDRQHPQFAIKRQQLLTTLRAMAHVSVVSRREQFQISIDEHDSITAEQQPPTIEVIVIGASTGGPSALHRILRELPADFPVPVVVVQHMLDEFIGGLARWLNRITPLHVTMARSGMPLQAGQVVISPGRAHTVLRKQEGQLIVRLFDEPGAYRHQPSVDALFESAAKTCGETAIGIILTGMGDDGAQGLREMRQMGAITIAQDETSSVVYGMPQAAVLNGAVQHTRTLAEIPSEITNLLYNKR